MERFHFCGKIDYVAIETNRPASRETTLLTHDKRPITIDDLYRISSVEDPRISPDGQWIAYVHRAANKIENGYMTNIWLAPTNGGPPIQLTRSGKDSQPRWSPDGTMLAFTSARDSKPQIYLLRVTAPGGEPWRLTQAENGAGSPAWSPAGTHIAYLSAVNAEERWKEDQGMAEDPPPKDKLEGKHRQERKEHDEAKRWDPRPVARIPYRVGTAFVDDRFSQVYVIPVAEGSEEGDAKPRRITHVDAHYDQPQWMPDGKSILSQRAIYPERDEPHRWKSIYRIDLETGAEEQLNDDTHTCGGASPYADGAQPSPDGRWIAYQRNPSRNLPATNTRLAIMRAEGGEPRDLTLEMDRSVVAFRWSADSRSIIFNADSDGSREIYRVTIPGGEIEKIIPGTMDTELLDVSRDGGIAFIACTPLSPPELFWQPPDANQPFQLTKHNAKLLDEVIIQPTYEMRFTAPDGQPLQGWYMLPVGYEEGKTYPLILNVHGGPHVMWSSSTKTMWHEWQVHAARGYAVFYCNPRGSDGYGEAFKDAIHGQWAEPAYTDIMAGVEALLEKGFVDPARMGVTGGSYGGYMVAWIVGHTNRFAAAFSQRGVYNLFSFYGTSDVPFLISDEFDTEPWQNPETLWKWSPIAYAHQIKTPLMIKAGENDYRVPIEQAEQLFAMVRRSGGTVEFLRYPRDGHELSRSGEPEHRISRLEHMLSWFDRYCMPDREA